MLPITDFLSYMEPIDEFESLSPEQQHSTVNLAKWSGRFMFITLTYEANLPELADVLEEIEFFERERTDRYLVSWRSSCTIAV
jgi:hypothetical protein